jgi:3-hydroxyisobutyrate dehydrogenase
MTNIHEVMTMKIGWIGTGIMGVSMAGHLQFAGHDLFLYNRTRDKAKPLIDRGGHWRPAPAAVAADAEVVFTMVGMPSDVEETYLGPQGILSAEPQCRIVVDMTTSEPALARRIAKAAVKKGIFSLDAPVSGGDVGARNATLAIMVGGDRKIYDEVLPMLQHLGKTIAWMGGPGAGQHTKMCNQILVAGTIMGVCESLLYAEKAGIDMQAVIDIIGKGAAGSWSINTLGPRIAQGDFRPGFYVEHFIKDMGIALGEAAAMGLALPGLALVHQLYVAVKAQGHGKSGIQALMLALRQLNSSKEKKESAT